jgi:hypothetical protein
VRPFEQRLELGAEPERERPAVEAVSRPLVAPARLRHDPLRRS